MPNIINTEQEVLKQFLSHADISFCNLVFEMYTDLTGIIHEMLNVKKIKSQDYSKKHTHPTLESFCRVTHLERPVKHLQSQLEIITEEFVVNFENYFIVKYALTFESLLKRNVDKIPDLTSYAPIVQNIADQLGGPFHEISKQRVPEQFHKDMFDYQSMPLLKGPVISFPSFVNIDDNFRTARLSKTDNFKLLTLLSAVALFHFDNTDQALLKTSFTALLNDNNVFGQLHPLLEEVSLRLFKNGRTKLFFTDEKDAKEFWRFCKLNSIKH